MTQIILNSDSQPIKNWEETKEGYLKLWLAVGVANQDLTYDSRVEFIDQTALTSKETMDSAVGKPLALNHPPSAITAANRQQISIGSSLQEYAMDSDTLYMASIVWEPNTVNGIKSGEYKYTSSAYEAVKKPQQDSRIKQESRHYNHFSVLTPENAPRAGISSKILLLNTDSITTPSNNTNMQEDKAECIELWSEWKSILVEKNKTIDYNLDSSAVKKLILSCYYDDKTIGKLNNDSILSGFWLNFTANPVVRESISIPDINKDSNDEETIRNNFIKITEGKAA